MGRIKGWRVSKTIPMSITQRIPRSSVLDLWVSDQRYIFLVKDGFGGFVVGEFSKEGFPPDAFVEFARGRNRTEMKKYAIDYLKRNPNG